MKCPSCGAELRSGLAFCESCGTRLEKSCPGCGARAPLAARFCGGCGAPFDAARPMPASPPIASEAERRQITVLFCDLVGSTSLSQRLDPEELRDVLKAYQGVCAEALAHFGGHLAKYLGDGVFAYFGYPAAQDEDTRRSVLAGLAILDGVAKLDARLRVDLEVRIGIHTGLVVIGEMGGGETREAHAIVGETPNLAARLESLAEPNSLVISAVTQRLIARHFACRPLGAHRLKGIAEAVEAFEVLREAAPDIVAPEAPMVGREQELRLMLERWRLVGEGHGQAVLLSGEAGIGKSKLLRTFRAEAGIEDRAWRVCHCSSYFQTSAFQPFVDLLERTYLKGAAGAARGRLEAALEAEGVPAPRLLGAFADLLGLPDDEGRSIAPGLPEQRRRRMLEALLLWATAKAAAHPAVLVVEDLHWADASTGELIGLLLEQIAATRLFVILTHRSEFVPPWPARPYIATLAFGRLSSTQVRAVAERVAHGRALPESVLREIQLEDRRRAALRRGADPDGSRIGAVARGQQGLRVGGCAALPRHSDDAQGVSLGAARSFVGRARRRPAGGGARPRIYFRAAARDDRSRGFPPRAPARRIDQGGDSASARIAARCHLQLQSRAHLGGRLRYALAQHPPAIACARRRDITAGIFLTCSSPVRNSWHSIQRRPATPRAPSPCGGARASSPRRARPIARRSRI